MRRFVFLFLIVLALPSVVRAQPPHYCDTPHQASLTAIAGQTGTLSFCQDGKDVNGNSVKPTGFAIYDNGVKTTPAFSTGTTSSVSGQTLYTVSFTIPATAGVHTLFFATLNGSGEGPKSTLPFVLTVNLPQTVSTAPVNPSFQ